MVRLQPGHAAAVPPLAGRHRPLCRTARRAGRAGPVGVPAPAAAVAGGGFRVGRAAVRALERRRPAAGVSADAAKTIFTPFSKSARGGMGLGLAICQRIASTLGGSLSWKNSEAGGAVFTFTVPLEEEDKKQ